MLGPGSRDATAGVPTSGRAACAAPPAAQAASAVAAAARAAADRHGDVSASAAVSTAERAGSATAAVADTAAAGFRAAFRGPLPGGAAPLVTAGGGDVASASLPPAPNGHLPTALRPVVRVAAVAGWGAAAAECSIAARPAPPTRAATRSPSAANATAPTAASSRGSFSPGALLGVASQPAEFGKRDPAVAAAAPQSHRLGAAVA